MRPQPSLTRKEHTRIAVKLIEFVKAEMQSCGGEFGDAREIVMAALCGMSCGRALVLKQSHSVAYGDMLHGLEDIFNNYYNEMVMIELERYVKGG